MINLKKILFYNFLIVCLFFLTLCTTDLAVENQNAPDAERALAEPGDVESLIAGGIVGWWGVTHKNYPAMPLSVAAEELTASWGNWGMQNAGTRPRLEYDNRPTGRYRINESPWYNSFKGISAANDGLKAIAAGLEIGDDGADNPRAQAVAKFVQGNCHAFLGNYFNQSFIFDENVNLETDILEMKPYSEVMAAAIAMLEASITLCTNNSFTLEEGWINGLTPDNTYMAQLTHSLIARYLSTVARTPEERAAVDWNAVISHIDQGVTFDFVPIGNNDYWWDRMKSHGQDKGWCRASMECIGRLDKSGNYQAWLGTEVADRTNFYITVDDRRITGSTDDPKSDGTDFAYYSTPPHRADRGTYFFSYYGHSRYLEHRAGFLGPIPGLTVTEMDLLKAEAQFRLGQKSSAADLINKTRVGRGQLPPVSGTDSDLWEMLKYEKEIETFCLHGGLAYYDARGWGDLIKGTPLDYPVPGKELEVLQMEMYTYGGEGEPNTAPKVAMPFDVNLLPKFGLSIKDADAGLTKK